MRTIFCWCSGMPVCKFQEKACWRNWLYLTFRQTKLVLSKSMEYGGNSITCVISSCAVTLDGNMFLSEASMSCDGVVVMLVFPVGHSLVFKFFNLYTSVF